MIDEICAAYIPGETSLRNLADRFNTNHHFVRRALQSNGIAIVRAKYPPFSDEHRAKISAASKGRKSYWAGKKVTREMLCKNMAQKIRFDISWEWVNQFEDLDKLKFLNRCVVPRGKRFQVSTEWYLKYIERFYDCAQFNRIYRKWLLSGKDKYMRPTIDHIIPQSKGGGNDLDNLQFLTWFENRCKNDMSQSEWDDLKANINDYLLPVD